MGKFSVEDVFREAEEQFTQMVEKYKTPSALWLNAIESEIGQDGRELTRKILQGHIDSRGPGNVGEAIITTDGISLTHRRLIKRSLQTLFGKIDITRTGYSVPGYSTLFPLDALLNLPLSSFSYGLQRFIARRISTTAFSEALTLTQEITGVSVGGRQAMQIVESCSIDFDAYYASKMARKNRKAKVLVLTTDGKGIVMREESLREETQKRALDTKQKMKTRLSRGEKSNRKRMAQVASIYFIEKFIRTPKDITDELSRQTANLYRPRPYQKRVWASIEKDSDDVIKSMFTEAHKRDPQHSKEWVILVDGNKHQLCVVKSLAKKEGVKASIILDIIHVIEYLWDAARVFIDESNHADCEKWVESKLTQILNGEAGKVAGSIRMSAAKRKLTKDKKQTAKDCARYIARHKPYMHYVKYLKHGYPIATGVIEGACRYLIKDRMDITGARWGLSGAESVLKLRSLVTSGDFDDYWTFHLKSEYERNYIARINNLDNLQSLMAS
jgi:hypothetical protein